MMKKLLTLMVFLSFGFSVIEAATWSTPPDNLSVPFSNFAVVGMDSAGNVVAVWREDDGVTHWVEAATFPFGGSWSTPERISAVGLDVLSVDLAVAPNGNAVAVWDADSGVNTIIQSSSLSFGGSWSAPIDVSPPGALGLEPRVDVDAVGNGVVLWRTFNGGYTIVTSSNTFGGPWGAPVTLSIPATVAQVGDIVVSPDGSTAVAVWRRFNGGTFEAQASTRVGGVWPPPGGTTVSPPGMFVSDVDVAIAPSGYAVIVYDVQLAGTFVVQARTQLVPNVWSPSVTISNPVVNSFQPDVELDASGNAIAVWAEAGVDNLILSSSLPFGSIVWSPIEQVSPTGQFSVQPRLDMDAAGNATVVWVQFNVTAETYASMRPFGGSWSTPDLLSVAGEYTDNSRVVVQQNGSGYAVVTWTNNTSDNFIQSVHTIVAPPPTPTPPLPPSNFVGIIKKNKFLNRTELVLKATWTASPSADVVFYRIYKNGVVVATVSATGRLVFRTDVHSKCSARQYEIAAVNSQGLESARVPITIRNP